MFGLIEVKIFVPLQIILRTYKQVLNAEFQQNKEPEECSFTGQDQRLNKPPRSERNLFRQPEILRIGILTRILNQYAQRFVRFLIQFRHLLNLENFHRMFVFFQQIVVRSAG